MGQTMPENGPGLRICFLTAEYPPMQGGVGDYTRELSVGLVGRGHEVHVVSARGEEEPHQPQSSPAPVKVHRVVESWGWRLWLVLQKICQQLKPDVLHIQYQSAAYGLHPAVNLLPMRATQWRDRPLIAVTFHDLRVPYIMPKAGPLRRWSVLALARWSDLAVVTNPEDRLAFLGTGLGSRLTEIPIGSNIQPVLPANYDRSTWRSRWGVRDDEVLLSYFGFLNESKGAEELIVSLDTLVEAGYNAKLLMVGGPVGTSDATNRAYLQRVQTLVDELGVSDRILWTGYMPAGQVSPSLVASDICVLPYRDGVSYRRGSFLAALAHRLPIVTTVPPLELPGLTDGENVRLVAREDPDALSRGIVDLIESSALRARVGEGAGLLAQSFEWENIVGRMLEAYSDCLRA